jgi:uncharacterized protein (DUF2141 family)
VLFAMALLTPLAAGGRQRDVAGPAPTTAIGTARISGTVVTTDQAPQPVRRAIVTLSGGDRLLSRNAITDDTGRFEFTDLPAGRFALVAARSAYVPIAYGAMRPGRPGTSLVLESGQQISNLRLQLVRGAAVTGTVLDAKGEPVPGLDVRVERRDKTGTLTPVSTAVKTDDHGVYRIFGLAAGAYFVAARPQVPGSGDLHAPSDAEVDAALIELQQGRNSNARSRVVATASTPSPALPSTRAYSFVPVYHPNALSADDATAVTLVAGEERQGVDVTVVLVSASKVEGAVVAPAGQSMASVQLRLTTYAGQGVTGVTSARPNPDGTFQYTSVPPGRYVVTATALSSTLQRAMVGLIPMQSVVAEPPGSCAFATSEVSVGGGDVSGLSLSLRSCLKIAGRLVFDGTTLQAPADLSKLRVTLMHRPGATSGAFAVLRRVPPSVGPDGTFEFGTLGELPLGGYQVAVDVPGSAPGQGWWLRSVVVDGQDVLDTPLVLSDRSVETTTAVLTLSDRRSSLSGSLQTSSRQPAVDYTVIAFTANRDWWTQPFRRVQAARPGTDGKFAFQDLPPGEYFLAALTDVEPDEWRDAAFLEQLVGASALVTIGEGEQRVQDLRITSGGS